MLKSKLVLACAVASVCSFASAGLADSKGDRAKPSAGISERISERISSRIVEDQIGVKDVPWFIASPTFTPGGGESEGGIAGGCPQVISTYTNASFDGGQYVAQGGFAEGEAAACSYVVSAADFPLRIDLTEMIFATSGTTVTTVTHWSVMVWEGTPATGTLVYTYSSDGKILPHLTMQPGTNGTNIQFLIDPGDPEQMIIQDNGSHTFSIGYRIDHHNNQTQNPCFFAPPSASNAFPTTDVGGLSSSSSNWLYLLNCGQFGCGVGWKTFAQLPTGCRPSGDWVMRCTWTPIACSLPGTCCLTNGTCQNVTAAACASLGGVFGGEGSTCTAQTCAANSCPCCFVATGGCVTLPPASCVAAGGIAGPTGQTCTGYTCFPTGACCLLDGTCIGPVSPDACLSQEGVYKGNGSVCTAGLCPAPMGAACFGTGFCLTLTEADALNAGASWQGPGTSCVDANANGIADACEVSNPADVNGDGVVNAADLAQVLGDWGTNAPASDINDDGTVDAQDLASLLAAWS